MPLDPASIFISPPRKGGEDAVDDAGHRWGFKSHCLLFVLDEDSAKRLLDFWRRLYPTADVHADPGMLWFQDGPVPQVRIPAHRLSAATKAGAVRVDEDEVAGLLAMM